MNPTQKRNIAYKAKHLFEDEAFGLLLEDLKTKLALDLVSTQPNEHARREELYMLVKLSDEFSMKLQEYVNELDTGD